MRTENPPPVRLRDYRAPAWLVETVHLDINLHPQETRVRATLQMRPNAEQGAPAPIVLDGDGLTLSSIRVNGAALSEESFTADPDQLIISQPQYRSLKLEIETVLDPSANTQLMGLYRSNDTYCTQCEAEGFRRITYFPDRPDVMAVYTTRVEAEMREAPVLLSNGNLVESGEIAGSNRHYAVWHDPFPKPSYLFALVAGDLACVEDTFTTMSGRKVALKIFVEHGRQDQAAYAMDSLKRSMRWDEEAFGREYDLDIFMIVAVSAFNMGAMENKGLNVFNDKYVLAAQQTATDNDYASIEAIIAHEYFHNWSGNRITCRDWFQLCLKEGLTVFRDQEFTSDQRSRPVKRIADVRGLRSSQFSEDAGPLAHPVRPEIYHEINNFYTATVYQKGAEIIRMLKALIGDEAFRNGMDLYFDRHDGEAVTIEQFLECFAQVSGRDLNQFKLWYSQAGTPEVSVTDYYDERTKTYRLELAQTTPPTPGQPSKEPMVIPIALGFLAEDGQDLPIMRDGIPDQRDIVVLSKAAETFTFAGVNELPVPSLNRGFSAPIKLVVDSPDKALRLRAAHDSDPFNRWQAIQTIATRVLIKNSELLRDGKAFSADDSLTHALSESLRDTGLDPAFVAQILALPTESDLAREIGRDVDPDAIFSARSALRRAIGMTLAASLKQTYAKLTSREPYSPDAVSAGRRLLKNVCLDLLTATGNAAAIAIAVQQYDLADNMTDRSAALSSLTLHDCEERTRALADFYQRFESDPLVIDKWFVMQATIPEPGTLDRVRALTVHPAFSISNPNRVRSLIGTFAHGNQTQFNRRDGSGYRFVADIVLALNATNPQVAARLLTAFKSWRSIEAGRRAHAEAALRKIAAAHGLSPDVADIAQRSLAA